MNHYRQFLHPEALSRLANLNLIARLVVEGFLTGLHRSPYHGFSVEFAEHRPYMPGDDIRHVDWKVYGKTDRFYVKEFEEETNLKAHLLVDVSHSMAFTSHSIDKLQYATYLSAALAYLMLKQRDAVGLVTFDTAIRKYLPPRSVASYLSLLLKELQGAESRGETGLSAIFHQMAERIHRRGLILVFSDLLDDPDQIISALKHFRHKKHEVIVFHILDPYERTFDFSRDALFEDLESGQKLATQPWHIRGEYRVLMKEFIGRYKREFMENRIDYVLMDSSEQFDRALLEYLLKRKRMGG